MRVVLVVAASLPFSYDSSAQYLEWAKGFSGDDAQEGIAVATNASGEIYLAGHYKSSGIDFDGGGNDVTNNNTGFYDIFIARFDADGNFIKAINLGGAGDDFVEAMTLDNSGDPVIVGSYWSSNLDLNGDGSADIPGTVFQDGFIAYYLADLSYDIANNPARSISSGSGSATIVKDVTVSPSGFIFVTGEFTGSTDFGSGPVTSRGGSTDAFLAKYNSSIGLNWVRTFGGSGYDTGLGITSSKPSTNEKVAITGYFTGSADLNDDGATDTNSHGNIDLFVIEYSAPVLSAPSFLGRAYIGGTIDDAGYDIVYDNSDNLFVSGTFNTSADVDQNSTTDVVSAGTYDALVVKYKQSSPWRNIDWYRAYGTTSEDFPVNIGLNPDGRITVSGHAQGDLFMSKLDMDGTLLRNNLFSADGFDFTYDMDIDVNGDPVIAGYYTSTNLDLSGDGNTDVTLNSGQDIFLAKYQGSLNGTYLIDPNGNIPDFSTAAELLEVDGISGPVFFDVLDATYSEQVYIPGIPGATSANTVEFRSSSGNADNVILTFDGTTTTPHTTLELDGTSNIRFRNITISTESSTYPYVIDLYGNGVGTDVKFEGCNITAPFIAAGDGIVDGTLIYAEDYSRLELFDNDFINGDAGIRLEAMRDNLAIGSNYLQDQAEWGISIYNSTTLNGFFFLSNEINSSLSGYQWGFREMNSYATIDYQIRKNRIHLYEGTGLIAADGSAGSSGNFIANNFITTENGVGLMLKTLTDHYIYHNSVVVGTSGGSGIGNTLYSDPGTDLTARLRNNIFVNYTGGYAYDLNYNTNNLDSDFNNLFTTGPTLVYDNGTELATIADVISEPSSISVDPYFASDTDLHTNNTQLKAGTAISTVPDDIDSQPRDGTTPFIGADESDLYVGLIAYYPFDNDFNDYSDNGYNLTSYGSPTATFDKNGNDLSAYEFDNTGDYGTQSNAAFALTQYTITAWFSTLSSGVKQSIIAKGPADNTNPLNYHIWIGADNYLYAGYEYSDFTLVTAASAEPIQTGKWYHVGMVANPGDGELILYINGSPVATSTVASPPGTSADPLIIGLNDIGGSVLENQFVGVLDEIRIYSRVLSAYEIEAAYFENLEKMSGNYIIGTVDPVNPGDYPTFNDAVNDLIDRGIDGDVVFKVENGTYNEQVSIPFISGTGQGYSILFESESLDNTSVTLTFGANGTDNYTLNIDAANNITFREMTLEATNSTWATVLEISAPSNNLFFENNRFRGVTTNATSTNNSLVRRDFSGTTTYDDNINFINNEFLYGTYGIYYEECDNLHIQNNIFTDQEWVGIELFGTPNLWLQDNIITSTITQITDGVYIESGYNASGDYGSPVIERNQISIPGAPDTYGLYIADFLSPAGTGSVINNFIHVDATGSNVAGMFLDGLSNFNVYHNSINITNNSATSLAVFVNNSDAMDFKNNILSNQAGGPSLEVGGNNTNISSDYNNFYSTGSVLIHQTGTDYADLSAWKAASNTDANSISLLPEFTAAADLHTTNVKLTSGTPLPSVTTDIDLDPRNPSVPTIGADEVDGFQSDSLVLVTFYDSLDGPNWTDKTNWLSGNLNSWYGITVTNNRVTEIFLPDNNLKGEIPPSIGDLTALERLTLENDTLTSELPSQIWNMTNLKGLSIRGATLEGSLPSSIGNLNNIELLDLAFNNLTDTLPDELGNLTNLLTLILDFNNFIGPVPANIGNLTKLTTAYFNGNNFTGAVPTELTSLDSLTLLNLYENNFTDLPDFSALTKLNEFRVHNNRFTFEDLEPNIGITGFEYVPQDSVGTTQYDTLNIGDPLTLSITVGGANNQYQWFLGTDTIPGATAASYTDDVLEANEFGDYYCKITNTVVSGLTLVSRPFKVIDREAVNLPDLTVTNISIQPDTAFPGHQLYINFDVTNIGAANMSNTSFVRTYLSSDATISSDDSLLNSTSFGALTVDSLFFVGFGYTFPNDFASGTYNILFEVDPDDAVLESNETNNTNLYTFIVSDPDRPDYRIVSFNYSPDPVNATSTFDVSVSVANQGVTDATELSDLQIQISNDQILDDGSADPVVASTQLEGLPLDSTASISFSGIEVPAGYENGDFFLFASADVFKNIAELDELNNYDTLTIAIRNNDTEPPSIITVGYPESFISGSGDATLTVEVSDNQQVGDVFFVHKKILDDISQRSAELMTNNDPEFTFTVPESYFDEMGMAFFIVAFDLSGNSDTTDIRYSYLTREDAQISSLKSGNTQSSYQIIGIPYEMPGNNTVNAIFSDDLGAYNRELWRLFAYNGSLPYNELSGSSAINQGKGYWFIKTQNTGISLPAATAPANHPGNPFNMSLSAGWNLIANPYPFPISWSQVQASNPEVAIGPLKVFTGNSFENSDGLRVFEGAFVSSDQNTNITIPVQRGNARIAQTTPLDDLGSSVDTEKWIISFHLESDSFKNDFGGIGMHPKASDNIDLFDDFTLPPFMNYLDLNHEGEKFYGNPVTRKIVNSTGQYTWNFTVNTNITDEMVSLSWDNEPIRNDRSAIILIDLDEKVRIDMKNEDSYVFSAREERNFRVLYARDPLTLGRDLIMDPYPNPFLSRVSIPFRVPVEHSGNLVSVSVIGLTGKEIKKLASEHYNEGTYEIIWDGKNEKQSSVSAGIYIIRFEIKDSEGSLNAFYKKIIKK